MLAKHDIATEISEVSPNEELQLTESIHALRKKLGERLLILGHHYQRDSIMQFADRTGDSLELSKLSAADPQAQHIIFCGVHFMAETADILNHGKRPVYLPSLLAGCSMADMASIEQVESAWQQIAAVTNAKLIPITYVNSTAAIKAFVGEHGGATCTSSNAAKMIAWALTQGEKLFFFPDQHLGRNTCYLLGIPLEAMAVWDPHQPLGGLTPEAIAQAKALLWKGHCSVHENFRPQYVDLFRQKFPGIQVMVHPECHFETVQKADLVGSTSFIIKTINASPAGSRWAIGTENHLVQRLKNKNPDKEIHILSPYVCQCATMFRNRPQDLLETLQAIDQGREHNRISVPHEIADSARLALTRMMELS